MITSLIWVVMGIMQDYIWRQAFDDPFMLKSFIRGQALFGIPFQASANEIDE